MNSLVAESSNSLSMREGVWQVCLARVRGKCIVSQLNRRLTPKVFTHVHGCVPVFTLINVQLRASESDYSTDSAKATRSFTWVLKVALSQGIVTAFIGIVSITNVQIEQELWTIPVTGDADRARAVQVHVYLKRCSGCLKMTGRWWVDLPPVPCG